MSTLTPYTVQVHSDERFCKEGVTEALTKVCTPWDRATHGDVLALVWNLRYKDGLYPSPIQGAVTLHVEGSTRSIAHTFFEDIAPLHHTSFALAAAHLQAPNGGSANVLSQHCRAMEASYPTMLLMPTVAALIHEEDEKHMDAYKRVTQEGIDATLRVLANPTASQHERLAQHRAVQQILTIATMWQPLHHYEGHKVALEVAPALKEHL